MVIGSTVPLKGRPGRDERISAAALFVLLVSLISVGIVSGTILRHVVQAAPVLAAAVLGSCGIAWSRWAAVPIFTLWLFFMTLIWLYLLGLAHVVTGKFTPTEVVLTIAIGISCVVGIVACWRAPRRSGWRAGLTAFVVSAAIQFGAVWLSVRPFLANR